MRILVVEDEQVMAEALGLGLRRSGWATDIAHDGASGLELAALNPYDVIVLDRDLPVIQGDEVCRQLVEREYPAKILMLTASGTVEDLVSGLELGADDYLAKPFVFKELLARVHALARRKGPTRSSTLHGPDGLSVDTSRREVYRNRLRVDLSGKEFGILVELIRAGGAFVSAETLLETVWDANADPFTNAVRVAMVGLRRKLGQPDLIETVRGAGYRLRGMTQ